MLSEVHLSNFKCFSELRLPLGSLTVLSGVNGGGKSSVIQSLVLINQTIEEREWVSSIALNGRNLLLGSASDVINQAVGGRKVSIGVTGDGIEVEWVLQASDRRAMSLDIESLTVASVPVNIDGPMRWLIPSGIEVPAAVTALRRLSWLSAERSGPRELLPLQDAHEHRSVGKRGEFAAGLLYWRESDTVQDALQVANEPKTLFHQVRAWMRVFFPGCDLVLTPIDGAAAITLRLRFDTRSEFQRPQNVGFGLTQLFPVLVQVLSALPGDVVVLENPEVHLHPRAQQEVGYLLAKAAASGVQVIVETHSDHVLNGIRLAAKDASVIAPEQIQIHFFGRSPDLGSTLVSPRIDIHGRLDIWPEGFFDQFDHALAALL